MKIEIIGSGGCVSLPKPLCQCDVCKEARVKGRPYSRFGCSIFIHDINVLIDTPEDIVHAINHSQIETIDSVLYSHMDPDHTLGFRVFEQLKLNWFEISEGRECKNPIDVIARPDVMDDLNLIRSKLGSYFDYYEHVRNLIKRQTVERSIKIKETTITFVPVGRSTVFVIESATQKVIYAPCDCVPFPEDDIFYDADYLIIGNTLVSEVLKDGYILSDDNSLRDELFSMSDIITLKEKYNITHVIMTHLEEDWGKSYDDYLEMEKSYDNITFAYDGMVIEL
jgi:phosphoribosyl 1,2-cyclic phosphate phosphodiesterase